jgi:hypothetical protein
LGSNGFDHAGKGGKLTIFVGDDWAEDHHDIHLIATDGAHLAIRRPPEGLAGIRAFRELVAKLAEAESARRLGR